MSAERGRAATSVLRAEALTKRLGGRDILRGVTVEVHAGEVVGLLGPNGAGKTTTFYCIVGLHAARRRHACCSTARRHRASRCTSAPGMGISYLPQEPSVFRKLTVEENLLAILETLPLTPRGAQRAPGRACSRSSASRTWRRTRPTRCRAASGGASRSRRALVTAPTFMLLDEPFAGIDPIAVLDIQSIITQLRERGIGVLITDHNVRETLGICDRAYILSGGVILEEGTPEVIAGEPRGRASCTSENASACRCDVAWRSKPNSYQKLEPAAGDDAPAAAGDQDPAGVARRARAAGRPGAGGEPGARRGPRRPRRAGAGRGAAAHRGAAREQRRRRATRNGRSRAAERETTTELEPESGLNDDRLEGLPRPTTATTGTARRRRRPTTTTRSARAWRTRWCAPSRSPSTSSGSCSMNALDEEEQAVTALLIGNMDKDGYLQLPIEDIAFQSGKDFEVVERALRRIQELDPPGVGARDLRECLLLQLRAQGKEDSLAARDRARPSRRCSRASASTRSPRSSSVTRRGRGRRRQPHRHARAQAGAQLRRGRRPLHHARRLRAEGRRRVRRHAQRRGPAAPARELVLPPGARRRPAAATRRRYIQDKMRAAAWLIKSIQQRQRTLFMVTTSIVKFQREFLDHGIAHLKPLVLKDVAIDIGMHESTVSRATANKYVHTPQGIFELKYFFTSSLQQDRRRRGVGGERQGAHPRDHHRRGRRATRSATSTSPRCWPRRASTSPAARWPSIARSWASCRRRSAGRCTERRRRRAATRR